MVIGAVWEFHADVGRLRIGAAFPPISPSYPSRRTFVGRRLSLSHRTLTGVLVNQVRASTLIVRSLRITLLGLAAGAQVAFWVLSNQEVTVTAYLGADTGSASKGGAIMGSGPDGSWGYTHTGSYLEEWPDSNGQVLIPSPDGAHVAASFSVGLSDEPGRLQHVVVFEAATGRVAARASFRDFVNVQLTNSVALIGQDAYSLSDGALLWSSPVGSPLRRSMAAAPEHLIVDTECELADDGLYDCLLHVLPQNDPNAETRVVQALTDPDTNQIVVVDGWTLTSKAPVTPDAQGRVSRSLMAFNLGTGESVEVGEGVGPDGSKFGRLDIHPTSDPSNPMFAASWFDPETRQVQR